MGDEDFKVANNQQKKSLCEVGSGHFTVIFIKIPNIFTHL